MTTETDGIVWRPTPEVAERSRIARFMRAHGIATLEELQRRSVADPEWYWDAVVRDLGVRWMTPVHARARRVARRRLADVVPGRAAELHRQLRRPPRRRRPRRQAGDHLGGRRRPVAHADLRRAGGRGEPPGQRAAGARRRRGRPRRHLPADVARGGDRHAGGREDRRHLHAVLLRASAPAPWRRALSRLRGQAADHRRRLLPPRPGREDEGDRRRGRGASARR